MLFFSGFSLYGAMLLLPLYYQEVRGVSALTAGIMLVPQGVGTLLSRGLAGRLTDTIGARPVAVAGFVIVAAATVPFAFAGPHTNSWLLALWLVIRGFGLGAVTIPVMAVAFLGLDKEQIAALERDHQDGPAGRRLVRHRRPRGHPLRRRHRAPRRPGRRVRHRVLVGDRLLRRRRAALLLAPGRPASRGRPGSRARRGSAGCPGFAGAPAVSDGALAGPPEPAAGESTRDL